MKTLSLASIDTSQLIIDLVEHSYKNELTHVPSALSMLTYVSVLFESGMVVPYADKIVIGKPFGSQAYYLVWKKMGLLDDIDRLSVGVKHAEIDFVEYGEETMGNALGVAAGIAMANRDRRVWVNISDATLQMGSTLEAIQYIGHHSISNITVCVDNNNRQVTGRTQDVLDVSSVFKWAGHAGWSVTMVDGHDPEAIYTTYSQRICNYPNMFGYTTIKGYGVGFMEDDAIGWHYRKIDEKHIRQVLK